MDLSLKAKQLPVSSFSPIPPLIHTGNPDFELVRTRVAQAIEKSESLDKSAKNGDGMKPNPPSTSKPTNTPAKPGGTPSKPANDVDDVASICKA
jgi:hypothetical protein